MSDAAPAFSGFAKDALPFLKALGFHQDRAWFHENKALYEATCKIPLGDLVEHLSERFLQAGIPLRGNRKTSLYRVNRDIRFSRNKDPYNTLLSALMTRTGTKKEQGFAYMHFSNERSFIATGFYALSTSQLRSFRELICREPHNMREIILSINAKTGLNLDYSEQLKRKPHGFTPDEGGVLDWIKLKHFTFVQEIDNKIITTPEIVDHLHALAGATLPFLEFGWRAVDAVQAKESV